MKSNLLTALLALAIAGTSLAQGFKKMKVDHAAISVVDLKKSGDFYKKIIGLDSIDEPFKDGKHLWFSMGNGVQLHIISGAPKAKEYYQYNHICLGTDNVIAFTKLLDSKKIPWVDTQGVLNKITTRPDGVQQIWVKDPDGYWIEVNSANK